MLDNDFFASAFDTDNEPTAQTLWTQELISGNANREHTSPQVVDTTVGTRRS